MTEQELLADDHFLGACREWQIKKRCPSELVDWFLDRDLERLAEAARWCHETHAIGGPPWHCPEKLAEKEYLVLNEIAKHNHNMDFPFSASQGARIFFSTFHEAIAFVLTHFDPEMARNVRVNVSEYGKS